MGLKDFASELRAAKAKIKDVFFTAPFVVTVTYYVKIINESQVEVITLSNDAISFSLNVTEWFYNSIKRQEL